MRASKKRPLSIQDVQEIEFPLAVALLGGLEGPRERPGRTLGRNRGKRSSERAVPSAIGLF